VALTLGVSAVIGLANGLIVAGLKVHGFIATLGMGLIISGYLATNFKGSFGQAPFSFRLIGATGLGPVPISTLIMLACAALVLLMLHRTRIGHHIYAVGGDRDVARMSGVRVPGAVITAHVTCSVLAGMAGLLLASRLGVGSPTVGSQGGYDLLSIAAVVLGGTLLAGGKGSVVGTLGGVLIFAMLDNIMSVLQINPFLKDVVRGVVIVVAVAVYARRTIVTRPPRFGHGGHQQEIQP
jgi:ribose transport system permease protein